MRSFRRNIAFFATMAAGFALAATTVLGTPASAVPTAQTTNPSSAATTTPKERPQAGEKVNVSCGFYSGTATTRRGDTGARVLEVQCLVNFWGYSPGPIDGDFGGGTEAAVRAFQESTFQFCAPGHQLLIDGVVGQNTWRALRASNGCP